jgi:serine/threonine protein kinase
MNILVDSPSRARLIDFGLVWSPDTLTYSNLHPLDKQFNPAITQEPPEVSYIQGILANLPPRVILGQIEDRKVIMKLLAQFFGRSKHAQMSRLQNFLSDSESFVQFNRYSYYKLYWSKIDAWAFGAIFLTLVADMLSMTDLIDTKEYQERHEVLEKVIVGLLDTDPSVRLDAAEALELFAPSSPVLRRADVKEWLDEQHTLRKELAKLLV